MWKVAAVSLIGGLYFGLNIGIVGPFTAFHDENINCQLFKDTPACENNKFSGCLWSNETQLCDFKDKVECQGLTKSSCSGKCTWNDDDKECDHVFGWSAFSKGIFACTMIVGAIPGSLVAGSFMNSIGRKKTLSLIGLLGLLGGALMSVARITDDDITLNLARIIIGVGTGAICVVGPSYVGEMATPELKNVLGAAFQVGVTAGILFESLLALLFQPGSAHTGVQNMESRIQFALIFPCTFSGFALLLLSFIIDESTAFLKTKNVQSDTSDEKESWTWEQVSPPLITSAILSLGTQFTGINAIMNFAPSITGNAGIDPILGNFLCMLINFLSALVGIYLASKYEARPMYLAGAAVCIVCCVICGAALLGIFGDLQVVIALLSIAVFLLGFECGPGTFFFVLATRLFPPSFTETGCSITNCINLIFNFAVNFGFPLTVEAFGGGKQGLAACFIGFAVICFSSFVYLSKFLQPWDKRDDYALLSP